MTFGGLPLLTLLLAALSSVTDARPSSLQPPPRRPPPQKAELSACIFKPGNNGSIEPSCSPNADFTVSLASTVGKTGSAWAKTIILGAVAEQKCNKHDVNVPGGKDACYADRGNRCTVEDTGLKCTSALADYLLSNTVYCAGSPFAKSEMCHSKFQDECGKNDDGCIWNELTWYGGKSRYESDHAVAEEALGGPMRYGACTTTEEQRASLDEDGELNMDTYMAWFNEVSGDPTNPEQYYSARGNCSYGRNSLARITYSTMCDTTLNTMPLGTEGFTGLNTSDSASLASCRASSCLIVPHAGYIFGWSLSSPDVFLRCERDDTVMWRTRLQAGVDGKLYDQHQICSSFTTQVNEAACKAARVY